MNIVSMSTYGANPTYTVGAIENAKLMPLIYPGWKLKVFVHSVPPDLVVKLSELGATVVDMNSQSIKGGMFWRFLPASDPDAEFVVCRDSDSRINVRERAAVDAWMKSGKICHIMRDHKNHHNAQFPIFAGMWGIKARVIDMRGLVAAWPLSGQYCDDLNFLRERVWPLVHNNACVHDQGHPFPPHAPYFGFVGQRFDQLNQGYPN